MSIADTIEEINQAVEDAKDVVVAKGGTVGDTGLAGLADEIDSIPAGGGGDDPGDWGMVWYWPETTFVLQNMSCDGCTVDIVNQNVFKSAMASLAEGGSVFANIMYSSGEGWMCWELSDKPMTTEQLESTLGISITDFDPSSFAMIMIEGQFGIDKTVPVVKVKLNSLAEYNSLVDDGENPSNPIVPLNQIWKFAFGRSVTSVPDGFLSSVPNLEYLDTTYAGGITTIGDKAFGGGSNPVGVRNDIEFANVTSIGDNCFTNSFYKGEVSFPEVLTVGDRNFSNAYSMPLMPKVTTIGIYFMTGGLFDTANIDHYTNLESIGYGAFEQSRITTVSFVFPEGTHPNIGSSFCHACPNLLLVMGRDSSVPTFAQDDEDSFSVLYSVDLSYEVGMKLTWYGATQDNKAAFLAKYPDVNQSGIRRKWRSTG